MEVWRYGGIEKSCFVFAATKIAALSLIVNKFIQKYLSLKTGPLYLTQAYLYQDERLVESAKRLCIENFTHLPPKSSRSENRGARQNGPPTENQL